MNPKLKGMLMQLPAILILIVSVIGSFYLKLMKNPPMTIRWATPITILIIVILYFWGRSVEMKSDKNF
jgi:hypothetical protein